MGEALFRVSGVLGNACLALNITCELLKLMFQLVDIGFG